ncbi:DgyrCDS9559 [Dimorphilus gyrociliatus]|uniref:Protein YIPF3 n=1 Tax=Dimorphilus gyrociliatus TaxID=2664684 RepID=A0A7I8VYZ8_9ANNE|nr:DgyrCDS9559 [Dimorphilus gyrociliatus]
MANSGDDGWNAGFTNTDNKTSVIDMESFDDRDPEIELASSDNISFGNARVTFLSDSQTPNKSVRTSEMDSSSEGLRKKVAENVTSFMWDAGKQEAKKAFSSFSIYGSIDILRPYFDVEPYEVRKRLLYSLVPSKPTTQIKLMRELYGPLMLVFTLIAILLFQMKTSDHTVQEGTLMGTAFAVCFGYWIGTSSFVWVLSYVCNSRIQLVQIMSMIGYALFAHCLVLGFGTIWHSGHDHGLFYLLWLILGGLSTVKMVCILLGRTNGQSQRLIISVFVAIFHMCFLLYLHFAYHKIVLEVSNALDGRNMANVPINPSDDDSHTAEINPSKLEKGLIIGKIVEKAAKLTINSTVSNVILS